KGKVTYAKDSFQVGSPRGIHADRVDGGHPDHRHSGFTLAAGSSAGARGGTPSAVREQSQTDWPGADELREPAQDLSAGTGEPALQCPKFVYPDRSSLGLAVRRDDVSAWLRRWRGVAGGRAGDRAAERSRRRFAGIELDAVLAPQP